MKIAPTHIRSACLTPARIAWEPSAPLTDPQAIQDRLTYNDRVQDDLQHSIQKETRLGHAAIGTGLAGAAVQVGTVLAANAGAARALVLGGCLAGSGLMAGGLLLAGIANQARDRDADLGLRVAYESIALRQSLHHP